ncbi:MAG: hydroxyacylglutathione hydrolase [bacterium]|nr:hydroxyacylglutathione hydrolase [bacterium]
MLEIHQFGCLSDNYGFLVHDPDSGSTACVDTPEVEPTLAALQEKGWSLTHIWNTHWHPDHTGGNQELQEKTGCAILGPRNERDRVPGIETELGEGSTFAFGAHEVRVFDVPGHTAGHIAYWLPEDSVAFVGDTLFALGCGRLFEGTAEQMWDSLGKLRTLPPETVVYCAHEYTQANARFALSVDPENADLTRRVQEIDAMRAKGLATVPTTIGVEHSTNPFLRADDPAFQRAIGMEGADPVAVFAETRKRKDEF